MTDSATPVPGSFDAPALLAQISEATAHLLTSAADLTEEELRGPSLCPGWTRGHVLTHLARNADGHANMFNTAATGKVTPMYASDEKRDADIEAGAGRSGAELLADLRDSAARYARAYADVEAAKAWGAPVYRTPDAAPKPAFEMAGKRLSELLIHHVDLDADFTPAHWSDSFTDVTFTDALARFADREDFPPLRLDVEEEDVVYGLRAEAGDPEVPTVRGPKRALLAWLMGRASGDGLVAVPPGGGREPLPTLPAWG